MELPIINAKFKTLSVEVKKKKKNWQMNKTKFLSDTEYFKLRSLVKHKTNRAAILLKFYMFTGARASEGLDTRLNDLDYTAKSVFIRGLKGSNDREIPLPPWFFYQLWHYAKRICKTANSKLFPFCYTILNRVWHHYKPTEKRFHSLRHTIAIRVYKATKDIKLVQILLGHRSIKNTQIYVDFVYSQSEMRRILKAKY